MDQALAELIRAHEHDPTDVELARRLEVALLRAGQREAALERYRQKFMCPAADAPCRLAPGGGRPLGCAACKLPPCTPNTSAELAAQLRPGVFLDVPSAAVAQTLELLLADPAFHFAEEPRQLCVRVRDADHGLVIAGLNVPGRRAAAVQILVSERGLAQADAEALCRQPVVPVLKRTSKNEVRRLQTKLKAAEVFNRATSRPRRWE